MKEKWYCTWCGKHRTKNPQAEQKTLIDEWKPVCSYCQHKKERLQLVLHPLAQLIELRKIPKPE